MLATANIRSLNRLDYFDECYDMRLKCLICLPKSHIMCLAFAVRLATVGACWDA